MRQIKFRAWDKEFEGGTMTYSDERLHLEDFFCYHEGQDLMQFTGLLDKNGKEIYEGDIVTAEHYGKEVKHIYEVAWSEGCCSFNFYCQTDENCGNNGAPVSDFAMGCGEGDIDAETIKVIGNIYENPELLNL